MPKSLPAPSRKRLRVVLVGFGRLGSALAVQLKKGEVELAVLPLRAQSVRRAVAFKMPLAEHQHLEAADLCVLTVPDAVISPTAALVRDSIGKQTALVHCAGAMTLSVFEAGERCGSFHPLAAISGADSTLSGHTVSLAASSAAVLQQLRRLAALLQMRAIAVPESKRAVYHAGAVLAAGLSVSVLDAAVEAWKSVGLSEEAALAALIPLARSALTGVEVNGLHRGLTGPIVRGDVKVVHSHLLSLPKSVRPLYTVLSRRALALTTQLPKDVRRALARLLQREP